MESRATVILATRDTGLPKAISDLLDDVQVVQIGSEPLSDCVSGRLWCFVDWLLPSISGLEVCRRLRESQKTAQSHITMVLDEDDSDICRRALRAGADNYVQGPLTPQIVADQIRESGAILSGDFSAKKLTHGRLSLDFAAHQVRYRDRVIHLRRNEFNLLASLIEHPDRLFTRSQLIAMLGKDDEELDERTVDVWIGRLRRSLKAQGVPDQLRTVRSMGYVFDSVPALEGSQAA